MLWTTAQCDQLEQLWTTGVPEDEIAAQVGASSVSSIRAKAWYLGLPRRNGTSDWPEAEVDRLIRMWAEGLSASQIAQELGHGLTRSAILGKVHRLKLEKRRTVSALAPGRKRADKDRSATQRIRKMRKRLDDGSLAPFVIEEAPQPVEFLALTFAEMDRSKCWYPRGEDAAMRFCGQPAKRESYCLRCYRICYTPRAAPVRHPFVQLAWGRQ